MRLASLHGTPHQGAGSAGNQNIAELTCSYWFHKEERHRFFEKINEPFPSRPLEGEGNTWRRWRLAGVETSGLGMWYVRPRSTGDGTHCGIWIGILRTWSGEPLLFWMLLCFVLLCFVGQDVSELLCECFILFYEILELKQRNSDLKNGDQKHTVSDLTESEVEIYTNDMDRTRSYRGTSTQSGLIWRSGRTCTGLNT